LKTGAKAKQQEMDFDSSCEVNNIKVKCIRVIVIVMFKDKIILFQFYRENTMNCNRVFFSQPFSVFFFFNSFFNFIIFVIKLCDILCLPWPGDLTVSIKKIIKIIAQLMLGFHK
jgi:hypothetical protein